MKKLIIAFITVLTISTLTSCGNSFKNPNSDFCTPGKNKGVYICEKTLVSYFDTPISLKLYIDKSDTYDINDAFTYFENTVKTYNDYFDNYNEYSGINNVYTINHSDNPVKVDKELFDAIEFAIDKENVTDTNGLPIFNIALGPVTKIWHDARESSDCDNTIESGISYCPVPRSELDNKTFNIDPENIILDKDNLTVGFNKPNMAIDLGGFGKGYATEIIAQHLDSLNAKYLLNAGNSNVRVGGVNNNNDSGDYIIALTKPSTDTVIQGEFYEYVAIKDGMNLVTSGDYQRFFKGLDDHLVYHHIIDTNTLYPYKTNVMSVTILYSDAAMADILSTAIYLMQLEDAKAYVESYPGLEAIWYLDDGTYEYSSGFGQYIFDINE